MAGVFRVRGEAPLRLRQGQTRRLLLAQGVGNRQRPHNQDGVIKVMRANLKLNSFKLWRARTHGQTTKHKALRSDEVTRHQSRQHNKIHR